VKAGKGTVASKEVEELLKEKNRFLFLQQEFRLPHELFWECVVALQKNPEIWYSQDRTQLQFIVDGGPWK